MQGESGLTEESFAEDPFETRLPWTTRRNGPRNDLADADSVRGQTTSPFSAVVPPSAGVQLVVNQTRVGKRSKLAATLFEMPPCKLCDGFFGAWQE